MQYSQGNVGRVFTLRLENGERLPGCLEEFAREHDIKAALCTLIGGADKGNVVSGPKDGKALVIDPILCPVQGAREVIGLGTLFPDESGEPVLHMHAALGRDGETLTGCIRPGLDVWLVGEVVVMEIVGTDLLRKQNTRRGVSLLSKE
ncbi:DNA-binding protein [Pseudodesulfovibrio thermohalotolerans]|jgi:predicted DNA-binding protein with PD1-like motif|uniref:PPC domain-containing DNA-binding protein n=1 Tax=Pseudodesulfovibrio thermohalotolerans TaxID=2880651 RepID=UPI0024427BEF|nr:DNA-binding protein [Pseudodesulfovibrio thermohalotolerans]WFS64044.1 DNA-binding protein [Pseudodesulfovibrio thermohalotolerans]